MHPLLARNRFDADLRGLTQEVCELRGWKVLKREWPSLDILFTKEGRTPLRTRWRCDRWDALPPSVELLEEDGRPLGRPIRTPRSIFHDGPHPTTGLRFICMAGVREYHIHESHLDADWDALRRQNGYRLLDIVTMVWNGWAGAPE